jgi:hypothetical protein
MTAGLLGAVIGVEVRGSTGDRVKTSLRSNEKAVR